MKKFKLLPGNRTPVTTDVFVSCCSSVARALVAKARGPGFNSSATTETFSYFASVSL